MAKLDPHVQAILNQSVIQTEDDVIDTLASLDELKVVVEKYGFEYADFLTKKGTEILNEEIIDTIKWKMKMWKFSPKIINSTYLDKVSIHGTTMEAHVISDYIAVSKSGKEFPVAVAREEGTEEHWVEPRSMKIQPVTINFQTGQITHTNTQINTQKLPSALHWTDGGKHFFSKGHMVSGIPQLRLIKDTIKEKKKIVKQRIREEVKLWVESLRS